MLTVPLTLQSYRLFMNPDECDGNFAADLVISCDLFAIYLEMKSAFPYTELSRGLRTRRSARPGGHKRRESDPDEHSSESDSPKSGSCLLSHLVGHYHRRQ